MITKKGTLSKRIHRQVFVHNVCIQRGGPAKSKQFLLGTRKLQQEPQDIRSGLNGCGDLLACRYTQDGQAGAVYSQIRLMLVTGNTGH